jgi:hypothetical protein
MALFSWRNLILVTITAFIISALVMHGAIVQDNTYHQFADQRMALGIANVANVTSNLPFLFVGFYGLALLFRGYSGGTLSHLRPAYTVFFAALIFVSAGSAYYHLNPSNGTLVWDRLPMTLAFMAFFAAILGEHVNPALVRWTLIPLLALGVLSVVFWQLSGDLRPYVLVQFLPVILIPAVVMLYPSRLPGTEFVWGVLAFYVVAKALEYYDKPLYQALGFSGHSLKHIVAAVGVYFIVLLIKARPNCVSQTWQIV